MSKQYIESSLTTPSDRDLTNKWKPEFNTKPLSDEETENAMKELNITSFVEKFPRVDRTYADPPVPLQTYALLSFTPAKGATPNEDGIYGFAKVRGSYATTVETEQRAEFLVRNVDSFHSIYHLYVGRPFPITNSSDYASETSEIDIRKSITDNTSSHIRNQKLEEKKTIEEIQDREKQLLEDSEKAKRDEIDIDPYDDYITQQVKKAQLTWTYIEHIKKLHEIKDIILKTRTRIDEYDTEHSDFKEKYFQKYLDARKSAGVDKNEDEMKEGFVKYMVNDMEVPCIDNDEKLPAIPSSS